MWVSRVTKPTTPGTLGMKKAHQGEHDTAPTFFPPHLSHLGHSCMLGLQPKLLGAVRVRISKATKPAAPGTLGPQKAFQGEHGIAPTLLPFHLSHLDHPCMWGDLSPSLWLQIGLRLGLGLREPQSCRDSGAAKGSIFFFSGN